ncbi:MAG: tetratricopeptide repeat protein [Thermodesulfobacteriota bacterium]
MNRRCPHSNLLHHPLAAAGIVVLVALAVYGHTLSAPFVFDDDGIIADNPQIMVSGLTWQALTNLFEGPSARRPLAKLTFLLNYALHRLDVTGYRLVNLALHIVNALLVYYLTRLTLGMMHQNTRSTPLLACLLWLALPPHIQSVTYIVKRMNLLATVFYLLALICYIQGRIRLGMNAGKKKAAILFSGCALCGLVGLTARETIVALPAFLFLYEWYFFRNLDAAWLKKRFPWLLIIGILCGFLAVVCLGGHPLERIAETYRDKPFTPGQRLLTQPRVVIYFVSLLLYPHPDRLTLDYDFPLSLSLMDPLPTIAALAALAGLIVLAIAAAREHPLPSFAIFWFLGNLAIESSFIGLPLIFEHRTYLPSIFPVMAVVASAAAHIRPARTGVFVLTAAICLCGLWTWQRNGVWLTHIDLWRDSVKKAPGNARACHNLGLALERSGDYPQAIQWFRRSLDLAGRRLEKGSPAIAQINNSLGAALLETGAYQEAITSLRTALSVQTESFAAEGLDTAEIHNNLGVAYLRTGDVDLALSHARQALEMRISGAGADSMEAAESLNNLGLVYERQRDYNRAAACFQEALRVFRHKAGDEDNRTATAWNNLGMVALRQNDVPRALACFNQALAIRLRLLGPRHPSSAEIDYNLGLACLARGDAGLAATHFRQALTVFRDRFGDGHPATRTVLERLSGLEPAAGPESEETAHDD